MILAGDIGGTKTMLAVFSASPAAGRGADRRAPGFERDSGVVETYDSRDFAHFDEILRDFCARHRPQLRAACIGVAGPVRKNRCSATHLPWTIDGAELARSLGLGGCALLNDLAAVGYGIDVLREDEIEELQAGAPGASGNRAVIAAGTGLGEAGLFWDGAAHRPFATEGGHADGEVLRRVIANLAANALRSSQGDAKVRLVASSNSLRARLEVQDNGPAIPESFRPRVFEKYATRAGDRGRDRRAVGLGLTFCRLAIEAHGGAIGFESGEDGTTFWIELPAVASPVASA